MIWVTPTTKADIEISLFLRRWLENLCRSMMKTEAAPGVMAQRRNLFFFFHQEEGLYDVGLCELDD